MPARKKGVYPDRRPKQKVKKFTVAVIERLGVVVCAEVGKPLIGLLPA
jgi:hypothetical protein